MHRHRRPTAFTLIEVLVVIGIIVLLIGLVLPLLVKARKSAAKSRTTADLALIGTALDAYKQDFHDYPRFTLNSANDETNATASGNGKWLDNRMDRGAVLLCRCLLGPAPAGPVNQTYANPGDDGNDGSGFRATRSVTSYGTNDKFTGPVSGPYIQGDKFPVGGTKDADNYQDAVLLDNVGNPILYYPALPTHGPIAGITGAFVATFSPLTGATGNQQPLYNGFDNAGTGTTGTPAYMAVTELAFILGDRDLSGKLETTETPATTISYLLWTAGADGIFGRGPNGKTDDVANFDLPVDLVK